MVLCSEVLQGQPTFSLKVPCHILSKVLLFTGILWVCAATESQHHLAVAFSYRVRLAIPPHTMPAVYPKATRKYVSLCLKKAQKSLAKGNFTLCFLPPLSKVCCVCLSVFVCKSNVLQNYSLKNTNICFTPLGKKKAASTETCAS